MLLPLLPKTLHMIIAVIALISSAACCLAAIFANPDPNHNDKRRDNIFSILLTISFIGTLLYGYGWFAQEMRTTEGMAAMIKKNTIQMLGVLIPITVIGIIYSVRMSMDYHAQENEKKSMIKTLKKLTWEDNWANYVRYGQSTEPPTGRELPQPNNFAIIEVMAQLKSKMTVYEAYLKGIEAVYQLETDNQCGACKQRLIQLKKQESRNLKKGIIDEELRDYIAAATRGYERWLRNR